MRLCPSRMLTTGRLVCGLALLTFSAAVAGTAGSAEGSAQDLLSEAQAYWEAYQYEQALEKLEEAAGVAPTDYRIYKARGDYLMPLRRQDEAIAAYRRASSLAPDDRAALPVQWSLWAVLDRTGKQEEALQSLQEIVRLDRDNPLAHLRLAKTLRRVDRLEESVEIYRRAVELQPDQLGYRLRYARALYDILQYEGARREIELVLAQAPPDSADFAAARNLQSLLEGTSVDKGRRREWFEHTGTKDARDPLQDKAWALTRGKAIRVMRAGQFAEAELVLRDVIAIRPSDHRAHYDLGVVLMELDRHREAAASFQESIRLNKYSEVYSDAVFRLGQCYAKMGRWQEATVQYERVLEIQHWREEYFYSMNFPDLGAVQDALRTACSHTQSCTVAPSGTPSSTEPDFPMESQESDASAFAKEQLPPAAIDMQGVRAPTGSDSSGGWFRQLIPAQSVLQSDLQTGLHEFIPLDPTDTFTQAVPEIYLMFALLNAPPNAVILQSRWVAERVDGLPPNTLVGTDVVEIGLNEVTGYFWLERPKGGWKTGTYRIDLYVGEQVSAYSHIAEEWFRIVRESGTR